MPEKILITGATGFLGSNICTQLAQRGFSIVVLKRSTSSLSRVQNQKHNVEYFDIDKRPLEEIFEQHQQVKSIIHCATVYGRNQESTFSLVEANLVLPLRLIDLAVANGVKSFINSDTFLRRELNHYSLSKKQFLDWMKMYSTSLVCCNMRLEHFYGPGDDPSKFVSWLIGQFLANVPNIRLTPGLQTRDFVYIDDVVDAFCLVLKQSLDREPSFEEFDVGTGKGTSIRELVATLQRSMPNSISTPLFGALPYRENELMHAEPNITRLLSLGWKPSISLEQGLKMTLEQHHSLQKRPA